MNAIKNEPLINKARLYVSERSSGRIAHDIRAALGAYEDNLDLVEKAPECRLYRAALIRTEHDLQVLVDTESEFYTRCEAAKAAAAS